MSIDIRLKHSAVNGKAPQPSDLSDGELALNTNAADPAIYLKDSAGAVRRMDAGAVPPADWTRAGTVLSPTVAGDDVTTTGDVNAANVTTTGDVNAANVTTTGDVNAANVVATGDVQATSLNSGPLAGFRNILINGDFRVWQRGPGDDPVPADFPTYKADRWFPRRQGQTGGTPRHQYYKINTNKYGYEYKATGLTGTSYIAQIVESTNCQHLRGQTLTFSIHANVAPTLALNYRDSAGATVNVPGTTVSLGGNRYSMTVTLPDVQIGAGFNQEGIQVLCWFNSKQDPLADGTYRVWDAQLEPGPVATPFEHRPIGTELALCQRYYEKSTFGTNGVSMVGDGSNGANQQVSLPFYVKKRAQPTVSLDNAVIKVDGTNQTFGSINATGAVDHLFVYAININNASYSAAVQLRFNSYTADAEL